MCALSVQFYIPHMWYCLFYRDYSSFYLFVNFRCIILWWNYSFDYELPVNQWVELEFKNRKEVIELALHYEIETFLFIDFAPGIF